MPSGPLTPRRVLVLAAAVHAALLARAVWRATTCPECRKDTTP